MKEKIKTVLWLTPWFVIYLTARIIYTLFAWKNLPNFKNWMQCTDPDFREEHTTAVVFSFISVIPYLCSFLLWEWNNYWGAPIRFCYTLLWLFFVIVLGIEKKEKL